MPDAHTASDDISTAETSRLTTGLYVIRWVIIAVVLLEAIFGFLRTPINRPAVVIAVCGMAIVTAAVRLLPGRRSSGRDQLLTLVTYSLFATVVIFYSDGLQSPFYPLYYIAVIMAAVSFGIRASVTCAAVAAGLLVAMEAAEAGWRISEALVMDDVLRTFPYLFLIAAITGAMRNRIQALTEAGADLRAEQERINREMELARSVQRSQLPSEVPEIAGLSIALLYEPAREVGGDLYDFYPVSDSSAGIAVADVAGKGVPAALLIASAKYALREHCSPDKAGMMSRINAHLMGMTTDDSFVTMLYGLLDRNTGEFDYVNAGHMPPIVVRATGQVEQIDGTDVPLGVVPKAPYSQRRISLNRGDTLVLYTDGITDALGLGNDGIRALTRLLESMRGLELEKWPDTLNRRLVNPLHVDDTTLVAVRLV